MKWFGETKMKCMNVKDAVLSLSLMASALRQNTPFTYIWHCTVGRLKWRILEIKELADEDFWSIQVHSAATLQCLAHRAAYFLLPVCWKKMQWVQAWGHLLRSMENLHLLMLHVSFLIHMLPWNFVSIKSQNKHEFNTLITGWYVTIIDYCRPKLTPI